MSPYERLYKHSPFDILNRDLTESIRTSIERDREIKDRREIKANIKRKSLSLSPRLKAYVKTHNTDKILPKWRGPLEILQLRDDGRVVLRDKNKIVTQNVRFLETGGGCGSIVTN